MPDGLRARFAGSLARKTAAALALLACLAPAIGVAQPAPSPSPSATPQAPAPPAPVEAPSAAPADGGFDASKLTPQQQAALQEAIIKASQNPVGNIAVVPFQFNNNYGIAPYDRYQFNLNVQPVVPFMLSANLNLIARTIVPIVVNPSTAPPQVCATPAGCGSTFGLSDIQEQLYFAPKTKPGALIWGAGPIFQFPTASPSTLGTRQWSAGPAAVGLVMPGPWVMGVLATQLWSFTGAANAPKVNSGLLQPFVNYNLKGGWAITTAPIITANYNAPATKWSVPIGGGGSKTFKLGDQPMQISLFYYSFVSRSVGTPQTNLRVVWSLLYPIKRGINLQDILQENGVSQP
ncbi:MAG TPA: hypothetical protein VMF61_12945 [Candidatus Acidoferrales bacterium]|nr:hypothetical protein [Candidatus Acidoferrales bacterium]